ncbi:ATP-binding protein [Actinoplanes sp. Pm04-4]|uniref:Sensor-like histidine kinase SenX3 n=1 Tax=Paractinoplanes pyxinae TaxID=2997416 RepID=A0ABT4BGR2_9ACTN|nr:ATP-binding protein [Actinoplanes pyxinae]MCY1145719.1 ATP-binding protein [Actinoplanes pyxinae]
MKRWRSPNLLIAVVLLGLLGTWLSAAAIRRGDENRAAQALSEQTDTVSQTVSAEVRRYGNTLRDVAAAIGAQAVLQANEFTAITAPIDRSRLPGASGVSLLVPASTAQIPAVQAGWRARGATDLTLHPADGFDNHVFAVLMRPLDGNPPSVGQDLAIAPAAIRALTLVRESRHVAASQPYHLLRDAALPVAQQQLSTLMAAPVYATSAQATDRGQFRGWVVLGLRGGDFLRQSIGVVARDSVAVTLRDTTGDGRHIVLAAWQPSEVTVRPDTTRTVTVDAPQRTWQLQITATTRLLPGSALHLQAAAWLVGLMLTALLAGLTATVTTSRDRALRHVEDATAALRDDITRREQVEEQLRRREAELVGFAGVIAHDLRSPLSRISGYADLLHDEAGPEVSADHDRYLQRLRTGAAQMSTLLDDLLDYATADNRPLTRTAVNLDTMVADIVTERTTLTTGDTDQPPTLIVGPLPTIVGDPSLLRQVLDNLIGNAIKYTHHGHTPHVEISAQQHPGIWRLEISDHGIGIPEHQRDTIFTPFTRASGSESYPGTGLGLAIVHRIIERHHGHITVTANTPSGSRFTITLPDMVTSTPDRIPAVTKELLPTADIALSDRARARTAAGASPGQWRATTQPHDKPTQ